MTPERPASSAQGDVLLKLTDVTKSFREGDQERAVLQGVHLTIKPGAFVVLIGRSGSGKSTLLNIISGIDQPSSGHVVVGGRDLTRLSEKERTLFRRAQVGFIFQSFNLIPTLTVAENILLPLELNGRQRPEDRQQALSFLERVGLADRAGSFPDRLSGGEQQRVAIARALAHDPILLLADEPTGNLDYQTGLQVLEMLEHLVRESGKTMLVVTHDRDLLSRADRIVELLQGRLTERTLQDTQTAL